MRRSIFEIQHGDNRAGRALAAEDDSHPEPAAGYQREDPAPKSRVWYTDGFTATTYADNGADIAWEATNYQAGSTGILIDFPGGTQGAQLGAKYGLTTDEGVAPSAMVNDTLTALEPIFPGVTSAFNGLAYCSVGVLDPHLLGAYSQYNIGQYTGFSGIEPVREGNIHFAGEHTSLDFQGFMEGAVTSGERVAGEI